MLKTIVLIILAVVVTAFIAEYRAYLREKNLTQKYRNEYSSLKREMIELKTLKVSAEQSLSKAQFYLKELEEWKSYAIECQPEVETFVRVKFARKEAQAFLNNYPNLASIEATYTNYPLLMDALEAYCKLSDKAKMQTHITFEILKSKRDQAFEDYVRNIIQYLQNADNTLQGIPEHLPQLTKIMERFNSIPAVIKSEVSGTIVISLVMKEAQAKYLAGMPTEVESEDTPEPDTILARFFDSFSNALSTLNQNIINWIHQKYSSFKAFLKKPLLENYYDDEDASDK